MKNNALLYLKSWFHQYVQGFYSEDEQLQFHVRLKEEHTLRVLQHASAIAKWLTLSPLELELAEIAALLHDIGRFSQYQTYRTFNDALSVNHAQLGLAILEQSDILATAGLSVAQQNIVKKAVFYHNKRCLPIDVEESWIVFAKITRDADKLDIYSMLVSDDKDNKIPQLSELKQDRHYSQNIIEELLQGRLVEPKDIKTGSDLMLFRLSWIYDINFTYSLSYIEEQQYVEKLIAMLPATDDILCVHQYIRGYIEENMDRALDCLIRCATIHDIEQIAEIYNQGIQDRVATLETNTKSIEEMQVWFDIRSERHKVIVIESEKGYIKGWASLNVFNARECYRGVADLSIYIRRAERGKGLGKKLLVALIERAIQAGFHKLVLTTFAINVPGQSLYVSVGFTKVGTYMKQGMLDGKWIDTTIMEKLLIE